MNPKNISLVIYSLNTYLSASANVSINIPKEKKKLVATSQCTVSLHIVCISLFFIPYGFFLFFFFFILMSLTTRKFIRGLGATLDQWLQSV